VPTPDDARAGLRAVLNQVPPTMEATRIVLQHLASLTSVLSDEGEISIEKLHELIARWAAKTIWEETPAKKDSIARRLGWTPNSLLLQIASSTNKGPSLLGG